MGIIIVVLAALILDVFIVGILSALGWCLVDHLLRRFLSDYDQQTSKQKAVSFIAMFATVLCITGGVFAFHPGGYLLKNIESHNTKPGKTEPAKTAQTNDPLTPEQRRGCDEYLKQQQHGDNLQNLRNSVQNMLATSDLCINGDKEKLLPGSTPASGMWRYETIGKSGNLKKKIRVFRTYECAVTKDLCDRLYKQAGTIARYTVCNELSATRVNGSKNYCKLPPFAYVVVIDHQPYRLVSYYLDDRTGRLATTFGSGYYAERAVHVGRGEESEAGYLEPIATK